MLQHISLSTNPMEVEDAMEETTDIEAVEDVATNVEEIGEGVVAAVHQAT